MEFEPGAATAAPGLSLKLALLQGATASAYCILLLLLLLLLANASAAPASAPLLLLLFSASPGHDTGEDCTTGWTLLCLTKLWLRIILTT
jgi:hypothetical protein